MGAFLIKAWLWKNILNCAYSFSQSKQTGDIMYNNTLFKHFGKGLLSLALMGGFAMPASAKTANWQNHPQCYSRTAIETPRYVPKNQVHIIGVGMSPDGELTRYELKKKVRHAIPDNFTFSEQGDFLDGLTVGDFITMQEWFKRDGSKPSPDMRTHFDVGSDIDRSYIYVLLPKSWRYSAKPIDFKIPAKKGKHPFLKEHANKLTDKAALLHHKAVSIQNGVNCYYEFNLNVDMVSTIAGHELVTPIIIDPGGGNEPKKPWD